MFKMLGKTFDSVENVFTAAAVEAETLVVLSKLRQVEKLAEVNMPTEAVLKDVKKKKEALLNL